MIFKIRRYDPSTQAVRYDHYDMRQKPGTTVLGALFYIQERIDDSLSFRYSCRGAVCGACAMLINRVPRLACRTQLAEVMDGSAPPAEPLKPGPTEPFSEPWKRKEEILIEPLPYLHTLKDLVVDMRKFFQLYRAVKPAFHSPMGLPESELRLDPAAVKELEPYSNCILCAACYGACPVAGKNPNYLGPAALAKLYRFAIDPREADEQARLLIANHPEGWWACEFYANCRRVCPKDVPPNLAIGKARQRLQEMGLAAEAAPDQASSRPVQPAPSARHELVPVSAIEAPAGITPSVPRTVEPFIGTSTPEIRPEPEALTGEKPAEPTAPVVQPPVAPGPSAVVAPAAKPTSGKPARGPRHRKSRGGRGHGSKRSGPRASERSASRWSRRRRNSARGPQRPSPPEPDRA